MKIAQPTTKRPWKLILAIALCVIVVLFVILEKTRVTDFIKDPFYKPPVSGPTKAQQQQEQQVAATQKQQYIDNTTKQETPSQPAATPTDTDTIVLSATQSGSSVVVHNELHGQGYSSGSCQLTVSNGTKTTSQAAQVAYQPVYSMCAGFSVPVSSLGQGTWTITLEVTPYGGQTLTKTITTQVQ